MKSKNTLPAFSVAFFLLSVVFVHSSFAQMGSVYLSAGYNKSLWYSRSTIHVEQGELGNSYNMVKVKGNSKTGAAFSPMLLNYRIGYFFNDIQTMGMEISYDPIQYAVANQNIQIKGTYNSKLGVNTKIPFPGAAGSYYYMSGANLFMVNFVRRYQLFKNNSKSLRVDILAKFGVGPAFPHYMNKLTANPVESGKFEWSGWDAGVETALRVTVYRFGYIELAGKYNYATFSNLKIYNGTATQDFHNFEIVASMGGALPTHRLNPLFFKERKIVTILPFYQHKDEIGRKIRKKKINTEDGDDSLATNGMQDIPEFDEIVDRRYRLAHPDTLNKVPMDSINNNIFLTMDSTGKWLSGDSTLMVKDTTEHLSKRELRRKHKQEKKDAKKAKKETVTEPENKAPESKDTVGALIPESPAAEVKAPETKEPETKAPEITPPPAETIPPAETKQGEQKEEVKAEEPKAPEMSKKERKRKEKEERKERKRKEKEDSQKKEPEKKEATDNPENKDKTEPAPEKKDN